MLPCIFEEGSGLRSTLAFCTCSNIETLRKEKGRRRLLQRFGTDLKNLECVSIPEFHCGSVSVVPHFIGFPLLMRILILIILFVFVSGSSCWPFYSKSYASSSNFFVCYCHLIFSKVTDNTSSFSTIHLTIQLLIPKPRSHLLFLSFTHFPYPIQQ